MKKFEFYDNQEKNYSQDQSLKSFPFCILGMLMFLSKLWMVIYFFILGLLKPGCRLLEMIGLFRTFFMLCDIYYAYPFVFCNFFRNSRIRFMPSSNSLLATSSFSSYKWFLISSYFQSFIFICKFFKNTVLSLFFFMSLFIKSATEPSF